MAINRSAAIIASVKMAEFIVQDERNACSLQRIFPGQPAKNAQESVLANRSEIMENLLYKMMGGGRGGGEGGGMLKLRIYRHIMTAERYHPASVHNPIMPLKNLDRPQ